MNIRSMTQNRGKRIIIVCALALLICGAVACSCVQIAQAASPSALVAQPNFSAAATTVRSTTAAALMPQNIKLSGTDFRLSTATPSISQTGSFNWLVTMRPSSSAKTAQIRFEVLRESGTLVYRRTRYINNINSEKKGEAQKKVYSESFERDLNGLSMYEGTYTIAVQVTVSNGTDRETASLYSYQYIYDAARKPVTWACALHFTSMPLRNADGIFVIDPAQGTPEAQRQALARIAALATAHKNSRITLYVSPLLLEDFIAISKGYALKLPSAATQQTVSANQAVPQRYASTLTSLSNALASGALTMGIVGYSDPNFTRLSQAHMTDDIPLQYARALSTVSPLIQQNKQSLEASITAPLGTTFAKSSLDALTHSEVSGVIVSDKAVKKVATVGKIEDKLTGYVANSTLSDVLISEESTAVTDAFFAHVQKNPLNSIITNSVVSNEAQAQRVVKNVELLYAQPWLNPTAISALPHSKKLPTLSLKSVAKKAPTKSEKAIYNARRASEGLVYALSEDVVAIKAREASLIAEFGAPLNAAQKALGKELRLSYADKAEHTAQTIFKNVSVKVASVTLSGREGKVPITIKNGNKTEVRALLTYKTSRGMTLDTQRKEILGLPPQETFLEPTVSMQNAARGNLNLTLAAGNYTICEKTVNISASYIDTIVIVVIVVVIGIALLLFIYRRVTTSDVEVNLFTREESEQEHALEDGEHKDEQEDTPE